MLPNALPPPFKPNSEVENSFSCSPSTPVASLWRSPDAPFSWLTELPGFRSDRPDFNSLTERQTRAVFGDLRSLLKTVSLNNKKARNYFLGFCKRTVDDCVPVGESFALMGQGAAPYKPTLIPQSLEPSSKSGDMMLDLFARKTFVPTDISEEQKIF